MRESWWHKSYGEQGLNVQQTHTPPRLSHTKQCEQAKALISILAAPGNELRIKILHDTRPQSWAQHAVKTKTQNPDTSEHSALDRKLKTF